MASSDSSTDGSSGKTSLLASVGKVHLTFWIFLSMILGIVAGIIMPDFSKTNLSLLSSAIFLPMIKACIVPLIFSTLTVGICGHGDDIGRVGRMAWKSMTYFVTVTFFALFIGLACVNITKPGAGVDLNQGAKNANTTNNIVKDSSHVSLKDELNKIFQPSFFQAAVGFRPDGSLANNGGEVLACVFFSIMFSVGILHVKDKRLKNFMVDFNRSLSLVMFEVITIVMAFAPFGIFGAMAASIGSQGIGILKNLLALVGTLYLGLAVFFLVILLPILLATKTNPIRFFSAISEPILIAFSTASSDAALPRAMENLVEYGVPSHIVAFVMPTGYSFNLDGSTLYLAIAAIFSAQASGIDKSIGEQIYMMLILMLTSKGVAAVPRASLVVLAAAISQFDMNPLAIGVILGVDQLMDMARTTINLIGNCIACVVISKWEGLQITPGTKYVDFEEETDKPSNPLEVEDVKL
ncbi:Sodium:dicarboxylate symporter [Globomyces pollinis-pini]|nr:Sodium:dicarboxylate symporter [Globomyces pollinis-pini]